MVASLPSADLVGDVDFELLVGQLLAAIGYVAAAVRWLHLAHGDGAVVGGASDEEGLALGSLAGGEGIGWNVAGLDGQPIAAGGAEHLVLIVAMFAAAPGDVGDAVGWMQLAGNEIALVAGARNIQLLVAIEAALQSIRWHLAIGGGHPAARTAASGFREAQDGCRGCDLCEIAMESKVSWTPLTAQC